MNNRHAKRYIEPSTQGSLILVTVQDKATGEKSLIVVDWEYFLYQAKPFPSGSSYRSNKYATYMVEHENEPFLVEPAAYKKLKVFTAPQPSAEQRALTMEQIADQYLTRNGNIVTFKDAKLVHDRTITRLLLEKDCVIYIRCLDGLPMISW